MVAMHFSEGSAKVGLAKADRLTRTAHEPVLANTDNLVKSLTAEFSDSKMADERPARRRSGDDFWSSRSSSESWTASSQRAVSETGCPCISHSYWPCAGASPRCRLTSGATASRANTLAMTRMSTLLAWCVKCDRTSSCLRMTRPMTLT